MQSTAGDGHYKVKEERSSKRNEEDNLGTKEVTHPAKQWTTKKQSNGRHCL